jgi:hypothetical protein
VQYMLLIHDDERLWQSLSEVELGQLYQAYGAVTEEMRAAGAFVAGDQLQPTTAATTVRERDGERLITDGPFAETKEQLGGYYLIEAESLDEAIEWAGKLPSVKYGSIEVRPIVVREGVPA